MKNVKKSEPFKRRYFGLAAPVFLVAGGIIVLQYHLSSIHLSTRISPDKTTRTYIMKGAVTGLKGSLADSGNFLYIDGKLVRTSTNGSLHTGPDFNVDTSMIKKGDVVEVRYARDTDGEATLNCSTCYIKKTD